MNITGAMVKLLKPDVENLDALDKARHFHGFDDIKSARIAFHKFSVAAAAALEPLRKTGQTPDFQIYECGMVDEAIPECPRRPMDPNRRHEAWPIPFFGSGNAGMRRGNQTLEPTSMIEKIIEWSLRNRFLVICGALLLVALGIRAIRLTPVDAIPDLTENQVLVYADWMGRSPQEVEDQVTFPLSTGLQGLAGVKEVRATSMFGFSLVTIIFEDGVDTYFARARVLERLNFLQGQMPEGVTPQLGPDASGLGWVYQYYLHVDPAKAPDGGYDLAQLRSLQDWKIRYDLASVQGVAEVACIGGFVKQYQVELSSTKMRAANVTLMEVMTAVQNANLNVGGKTVEENGAEFVLRGIGLVTSPEDLELVTVKAVKARRSI